MAGAIDPFRAQRNVCLQAPVPNAKVSKLRSLSAHGESGSRIGEISKGVLKGDRIQRVQAPGEARGELHLVDFQAIAIWKPNDSISTAKAQVLIASNAMRVTSVCVVINTAGVIEQDGLAGGTGHAGQITHSWNSRKSCNG